MFEKLFQETKSAVILRYKNFFILWLDHQSSHSTRFFSFTAWSAAIQKCGKNVF